MLKILSLPVDDGGCGWYRIRQPFEQINERTEHESHVIDNQRDDMVEVTRAMTQAQVCVVRQGGEEGMRKLKAYPEFSHLKWVLDIDDNVELVSPYSQHYKEYGVEEFYDRNRRQWLWRNGRDGFELSANRTRLLSLLKGMSEADLVSVTTPILAEYARQYNPNVAVLPNCVDTSAWWPLPLRSNKTLRVGWSGGVSHYEDWYEIREPLNALLREKAFTLVMVGSHYDGLIDPDNRARVEVWPWVPFKAHSYRTMCLNLDVAIVPLADLPFNRYKSSIKWYEFAAAGIPAIVADREPYRGEIGQDRAFCYRDAGEFSTALRTALERPQARAQIARAARAWVLANRDAGKSARLWTDAYGSLLDK